MYVCARHIDCATSDDCCRGLLTWHYFSNATSTVRMNSSRRATHTEPHRGFAGTHSEDHLLILHPPIGSAQALATRRRHGSEEVAAQLRLVATLLEVTTAGG